MTTDKNKNDNDNSPKKPKRSFFKKHPRLLKFSFYSAAVSLLAAGTIAVEANYSYLQSRFSRAAADGRKHATLRTTGPTVAPPAYGPYDVRNGYTQSLQFRERLTASDYTLLSENSWLERDIYGFKIFPIYPEKAQTGLTLKDGNGFILDQVKFPQVYENFDAIPPVIVKSLLYVENRKLLDEQPKKHNVAVDWWRFTVALYNNGKKVIGLPHDPGGGSTLATQIEKYRHARDGITTSGKEKIEQMMTATIRSYMNGETSTDRMRDITLRYLNSMPLSAYPGFGEVSGLPDGMTLWFGADMKEVNRVLSKPEQELTEDELRVAAKAYRHSLSLIMAVKKPSAFLGEQRAQLDERINDYLRLMKKDGVITPRFADAALAEKTEYADPKRLLDKSARPKAEKTVQSLQIDLMQTLGVRSLYDLRLMDIAATTTVDGKVSRDVTAFLKSLEDPETAKKNGLTGFQLLKPEQAPNMTYAFTLYERLPDGSNVLRVQTDNFDGQLNLNEGTKLELGSTAKLRTLVSYLEAFAYIHDKYKDKSVEELQAIVVPANDHITRWSIEYLTNPETDKSLMAMLEGALERKYHGSPREAFFTAGGLHTFENFEREEDFVDYTVKEAFHLSVNLSFVRMMRDIVSFTQFQKMGIDPDIYEDTDDPQRMDYLAKFADAEGKTFQWQFWKEMKDKSADEILSMMAAETRRSPAQLAVVFRSLHPQAPYEKMEEFIRKECLSCDSKPDFRKLYDDHAPGKFNLNDRGYIASVHPLALWVAAYRIQMPNATWSDSVRASEQERQESYSWLFKPGKTAGQNTRIRIMLEKEAFTHIHKTWKAMGYPFNTLVASYATSLGVSGDTPAALADLAGIIQNDGLHKKYSKFSEINIAEGTPYAMKYQHKEAEAVRVLPAEVAQLVRREMQGVVEEGTGRRIKGQVTLSDGRVLSIGGKTGTGDNRVQIFSAPGVLKSSTAKNRTGTFVYAIDDRFYGCVTAYIDGPEADDFKFTSGLAVQVMKSMMPKLRPVFDRAYGVQTPEAAVDVKATAPMATGPGVTPQISVTPKTEAAKSAKPKQAA